MQKNILIPIIISAALIVGVLYILSGDVSPAGSTAERENSTVRDSVQYVTIVAKGGYTPRVSEIEANVPTKLVIKTNGTYDCSSSLVIRSLNFQKVLQPTGEEVIDIGTPKQGEELLGVCSMGMYSFRLLAR